MVGALGLWFKGTGMWEVAGCGAQRFVYRVSGRGTPASVPQDIIRFVSNYIDCLIVDAKDIMYYAYMRYLWSQYYNCN